MTGVPPRFLIGEQEIAERLDLGNVQSVHTIKKRHAKFPTPLVSLKTALIWHWQQVKVGAQKIRPIQVTSILKPPREESQD